MYGLNLSNSKKDTKKYTRKEIGFILKNQLEFGGVWLLKRVSPICEACSSTQGYLIWKDTYTSFLNKESYYKIACVECKEAFKLDYEEYLKIYKIVKLNQAHKKDKLSDQQYYYKLDKLIEKTEKKLLNSK